jgi:predicted TIM-barrel fold metal-dependent hydrolase
MRTGSEAVGFPIFDADNHFYETRDALTKHLPPERQGAIQYVEVDGRTKIAVRGLITDFIPNPTFERIGRPGAQEQYFKHGNPEGKSQRELIGRGIDCPPAFRSAPARLALMDEQGIDYALMMPTLVSLVEERMREDPDLCADVIHAFNQWMVEEWPFVYEDRIFAVPYLTPVLVDRAVQELDWLVERGARAVLMRPAPAWGHRGPRSFALPEFDPFWKRMEETGTLAVFHVSDAGYDRYYDEWPGGRGEMAHFGRVDPFKNTLLFSHRPIEDTVASLICHGALWRFPGVRILLVENGGSWVPNLLDHMDHVYSRSPQEYEMKPSDTFNRNIWVQVNHEEDPRELIARIGAERVLFGSDYPHVEGLADPLSYLADLAGRVDEEDVRRKIMGGNMMTLLGIADRALA